MKVYLVDDSPVKQQYYMPLLEELNRRSHIRFERGFRDVATAHYDPQALWEAVSDSKGVCLLDLSFPDERDKNLSDERHSKALEALQQMLQSTGKGAWIQEYYKWYSKGGAIQLGMLLHWLCYKCETPHITITTVEGDQTKGLLKRTGAVIAEYPYEENRYDQLRAVADKVLARLDWLNLQWGKARPWFKDGTAVPHAYQPSGQAAHQHAVHSVWPWIPDCWWNGTNPYLMHDLLLKPYCRRADAEPLTIGAAYFLLLAVLHHNGWGRRDLIVDDLETVGSRTLSAVLFPNQHAHVAERTIQALAEVFRQVSSPRPEPIKGIQFRQGAGFVVHLAWDAGAQLGPRHETLVSLGLDNQLIKRPEEHKADRALFDLSILMGANVGGFGAPGVVQLDRNALWVTADDRT